VFVLPVIN